jgi:hypothetical protein
MTGYRFIRCSRKVTITLIPIVINSSALVSGRFYHADDGHMKANLFFFFWYIQVNC